MDSHCTNCHETIKGMAKHLNDCVPQDIDCKVCPSPQVKALEAQIHEQIKKRGKCEYAEGIFGDYNQNKAFFGDAVMTPKGMQYPIFGCSYLYPNTLLGAVHDSCTSLKRTLMATVGVVLKHWYFFSPLILVFWKTAVRAFVYWFAEIFESDLKQKTYKYLSEFAPVPREMIRAGLGLAYKIPLKENKVYLPEDELVKKGYDLGVSVELDRFFTHKEFEGYDSQEYRIRVKRCIWATGTFIQSDSAYKTPVQDAISNLDKEKLKENPRQEILRLFDIVLERGHAVESKAKQLRKLASIFLLFPPIKKIAYDYFNELDVTQFIPDEADTYFAARKFGYDFEGKSIEERRAWANMIDGERGHTILKT